MNLDEKISRSIDARMGRVLDLFQDTSDDAGEILGLLKSLVDQIPLLEDIKTEVKQLQNQEKIQPEDEEEPENDPSNDPSPSDPELPEMRRRLLEMGKGMDKMKRVWDSTKQLLPSPSDPIPEWFKDMPWYDLVSSGFKAYYLWKQLKENREAIDQNIRDLLNGDKNFQEMWKANEEESWDALDKALEILNSDMEDLLLQELPRLFQIGSNVDDKLTICCQNQTSGFQNLDDKADNVQSAIDGVVDDVESIKDAVDNLDTASTESILNLPSYIQNQTNILRGLL